VAGALWCTDAYVSITHGCGSFLVTEQLVGFACYIRHVVVCDRFQLSKLIQDMSLLSLLSLQHRQCWMLAYFKAAGHTHTGTAGCELVRSRVPPVAPVPSIFCPSKKLYMFSSRPSRWPVQAGLQRQQSVHKGVEQCMPEPDGSPGPSSITGKCCPCALKLTRTIPTLPSLHGY
jgi:hypothetical protein